jgi:hypothetical protein
VIVVQTAHYNAAQYIKMFRPGAKEKKSEEMFWINHPANPLQILTSAVKKR